MRIIFSGGGTLGPVMPLLSVIAELKKRNLQNEFLWVGTYGGVEKKVVEEHEIKFKPIVSAKLRRYFSFKNLIVPFQLLIGFYQSVMTILKFNPEAIISAGGYNSVPLVWAASTFKIPVLIHQQDVLPGLANKLMAPFAKKITVTFEQSLKDFDQTKTVLTGNPIRTELYAGDRMEGLHYFDLEDNLPTVLFIGGGTGAAVLNAMIIGAVPQLTRFCQIIHSLGEGKNPNSEVFNERYHGYEFIGEHMAEAFAVADLVVSRAGLSSLSELASLGKAAIIIPMPDSHQEDNAQYFYHKDAALVLDQNNLKIEDLVYMVKKMLNKNENKKYIENIKKIMPANAVIKIADEIEKIVK
ncbi:MAG: UDP-N-acetylglucosamine--N-acetylmuramyl-(pentapeptide) pyrophosphoryl-undecaprenol N-acetylglucosamine transferase [Patescibacteria group bacterium]